MWANVLLVIILVISVITDLKSRKIYNKVIFPAFFLAIFLHLFLDGWSVLFYSIVAFLLGIAILIIPYFLGGMGAGDVKLLALVGAIKGISFVFYIAIYMGLIGGIIAMGIIFFRKGVLLRLKSILYYFVSLRYGMRLSLAIQNGDLSATYPYGVAIAGGALASLLLKGGYFL